MFNFTLTREQIEYKGYNTIHNNYDQLFYSWKFFPTGRAVIGYLNVT